MPQTVGIPLARPALQIEQEELPQQLLQAMGCSRRIPEIEKERRSMNPVRANSAHQDGACVQRQVFRVGSASPYCGLPTATEVALSRHRHAPTEQTPASSEVVTITHPFHPWRGRTLSVHYCQTGGQEPNVRSVVDAHRLRGIPAAWTNLRQVDDFERVSAGRAWFRPDDLAELRVLVDVLLED